MMDTPLNVGKYEIVQVAANDYAIKFIKYLQDVDALIDKDNIEAVQYMSNLKTLFVNHMTYLRKHLKQVGEFELAYIQNKLNEIEGV